MITFHFLRRTRIIISIGLLLLTTSPLSAHSDPEQEHEPLLLPQISTSASGNASVAVEAAQSVGTNDSGGGSVFLPSIAVGESVTPEPSTISTGDLVASLQLEKQVYAASEAVSVRFSLTNTSGSPLYLLKWGTPFDGFRSDMFVVTSTGAQVPYTGILVKRGTLTQDDYLLISPGSEVSAVLDLSQGYAIESAGKYEVEYPMSLDILPVGGTNEGANGVDEIQNYAHITQQALLPAVHFIQQGERRIEQSHASVLPEAFSGCSTSERASINSALKSARTMSSNAVNALQGASSPSKAARYITWFGPYAAARYQTVTNHFVSIRDTLMTETIDWDCSPPPSNCTNIVAYVYSATPYEIHLCSAFFLAGASGTDSRPGTIIHETSHFNVVAGTDDHFYYHDNSLTHAQSSPTNAIDNADSHEYFAENVPALPMTAVTNPVYVRASNASTEIGTEALPCNTIGEGVSALASGGNLVIKPGTYSAPGTYNKAMTWSAPSGGVTIH